MTKDANKERFKQFVENYFKQFKANNNWFKYTMLPEPIESLEPRPYDKPKQWDCCYPVKNNKGKVKCQTHRDSNMDCIIIDDYE